MDDESKLKLIDAIVTEWAESSYSRDDANGYMHAICAILEADA